MNFQRVKSYLVFRYDEAEKTTNENTEDTFQTVKMDVILATTEENGTQIMEVLGLMFRMCSKVV